MVAIVAVQNTAVAQHPGDVWRITKTGGFDEAFDAPAKSLVGFAGDCVMRARRVGDADRLMVGLTANPDEDTGYVGIDWSLAYRGDVLEVFERGDYRTYNHLVGDFVWIERIGTTLRYLCGPKRAGATVMRSVAGVTATLFFDSSLVTPGSAVDVRFGAPWDARRPRQRTTLGLSL